MGCEWPEFFVDHLENGKTEDSRVLKGWKRRKRQRSPGSLTQTYEDLPILLSGRAYVWGSTHAVRRVTAGCDASNCFPNECGLVEAPVFPHPAGVGGTGYGNASRWRCGLQPFGLCANLRFCDESADSQAVPSIGVQTSVNQLRNMALGRALTVPRYPDQPVSGAGFGGSSFASTTFSTG